MLPMIWLVIVTQTAAIQKIFHADPRIGFLAEAHRMSRLIAGGQTSIDQVVAVRRLIFNNRLDAAVTGFFAVLVLIVVLDSAREWLAVLRGRKTPAPRESEYVASALAEE